MRNIGSIVIKFTLTKSRLESRFGFIIARVVESLVVAYSVEEI